MSGPELTQLLHDALSPHEGRDVRCVISTPYDVTIVDDEGGVWLAPLVRVGQVETVASPGRPPASLTDAEQERAADIDRELALDRMDQWGGWAS